MGGLPHYNSTRAAVNKYEPVTYNMFEVTLFAPDGLGIDSGLLLEHVTKVTGMNLEQSWEQVEQKYKYAKRTYAGVPDETGMDVTIEFTLNLNDANENYVYNMIRRWRNRVWNPQTGEMGLKRDYCGSALIVMHNRAGDVYRRIVLKDIWPKGDLASPELDYGTPDAQPLAVMFRCDNFEDESLGL